MSTATSAKIRENRLRRMARAQGYSLTKSRTRYERAIDFGCYMIVDAFTNTVVAGTRRTGCPDLSLDDVENWLEQEPRDRGTHGGSSHVGDVTAHQVLPR